MCIFYILSGVFERLALVLLDKDKLIENGFSKLINDIDDSEDEYELEWNLPKT